MRRARSTINKLYGNFLNNEKFNVKLYQLIYKGRKCLCSLESHINAIFCRVQLHKWENDTRGAHSSVTPSKFFIPPQYVLSVCSFSKTVRRVIGFLGTYVTSRPYYQNKNISIGACVLKGHI